MLQDGPDAHGCYSCCPVADASSNVASGVARVLQTRYTTEIARATTASHEFGIRMVRT